jgi:hypothetical protein
MRRPFHKTLGMARPWCILIIVLLSLGICVAQNQERDRNDRRNRRRDRDTRPEGTGNNSRERLQPPSRPGDGPTDPASNAFSTNRIAAESTNSITLTPTNDVRPVVTNRFSLEAFRIIPERNIFNPNRTARSAKADQPPEKVVKVETFSLLGTMAYEKGRFAVFDGSSRSYKKVAPVSESIAGYKVSDIQQNFVTLEKDGKSIQLNVGQQMKREDEGEWTVSAVAGILKSDSSSNSSSSTSSPSSGEDNDILKRLLQKREQELKK